MKVFEVIVDFSERYIVLSTTASGAIKKALDKREKEYPGVDHAITELSQLKGVVIL